MIIRCSVEDGLPETLRVRTTVRSELGARTEQVRTFGVVEAAVDFIQAFLAAFVQPGAAPGDASRP